MDVDNIPTNKLHASICVEGAFVELGELLNEIYVENCKDAAQVRALIINRMEALQIMKEGE